MTQKELYEKLCTIMEELPPDSAGREEFVDVIRQLAKWSSNPSYSNAMRMWWKHSGY